MQSLPAHATEPFQTSTRAVCLTHHNKFSIACRADSFRTQHASHDPLQALFRTLSAYRASKWEPAWDPVGAFFAVGAISAMTILNPIPACLATAVLQPCLLVPAFFQQLAELRSSTY